MSSEKLNEIKRELNQLKSISRSHRRYIALDEIRQKLGIKVEDMDTSWRGYFEKGPKDKVGRKQR